MPAHSGAIAGTVAHKHSAPSGDGGELTETITNFSGGNLGEVLTATATAIPVWSANTANPLIKVSKTFSDIAALEMDIYTLGEDAALVNLWADITTQFDVSTAVTVGDGSNDNGFMESTDWTASTGLTDATRGVFVSSFKTMLSTSGTTAIKAYNFSTTGGGGSTFTQSNTDDFETIAGPPFFRPEMCQLYQAGQVLIGEDVCKATWFIKDTPQTATGDIKAYIRQSDGTLVATSTTVLDASTLTGGYIEYTFDFPATTMVANYMICLNGADMTNGSVDVQLYTTDIANGLVYLLESSVYVLKTNKSITGTITYDCTPVVGDTVGAVDFYLQVVD